MKNESNEKKKKILIVTAFPTHGAGSGALITVQAKSYVEDGHDVVIITGNNRTDFDKIEGVRYHIVPFTAESDNHEQIEGQCKFNYLMFTTHTESTANFWNATLEQIEEYVEVFTKAIKEEIENYKPDIIHAQHNWISSSIATRFDKPVALTIHGTDLMGYKMANEKLEKVKKEIEKRKENQTEKIQTIENIYNKYSSKKQILIDIKRAIDNKQIETNKQEIKELVDLFDKKIIYNLYIEHAENSAKKSNKIIVISNAQKEEFSKLFPKSANKVILLENGYDTKTFYKDEKVKKEDVIPEEKRDYDNLVLFVGKFADFKGIDVLLNATKIYETKMEEKGKKVETILVGSGVLDDKLRKQAEKLGLKNTDFVGRKNHKEICKLQNLADVSIIPSRNEPFGLVVIEGTACGHPVIATNAGGIPGILNTEHEDIEDTSKSYQTPLGILVPPIPERFDNLDDEQKDELDEYMTQYILSQDEEKEELVNKMSENLQINRGKVEEYANSYSRTVENISDGVIGILSREIKFDNEEIAEYTKENYSQNIIREKLLKIFDEAIYNHNQSKEEILK